MRNFYNLRFSFIALLITILAQACSSPPPPRPEVDIEPEKKVYESGSLWPGKSKQNTLFADNKASRVGDIVTVHVVENTSALNRTDTASARKSGVDLTLDTGGAVPTAFDINGGLSFTGKGATGRSDKLSATVSCLVTEVLPNGNLKIDGQKRMQINSEEQYVLVNGIVRPDDITFDNSVLSTKIANADIRYTGDGSISESSGPGWLGGVLGYIWPF